MPEMDVATITTIIGGAIGSGGIGALVLKGYQTWTRHQQAIDGDFAARTTARRDDFQTVVDNLQSQVQEFRTQLVEAFKRVSHLEDAERKCREEGLGLKRRIDELTASIRSHRGAVVLIEDSANDEKIVSSILSDTLAANDIDLITVRTLAAARHYPLAMLFIADVILENTSAKEMTEFIDKVGKPVIVHTSGPDKDFPSAAAVIEKWDAHRLVSAVYSIVGYDRVGEQNLHRQIWAPTL